MHWAYLSDYGCGAHMANTQNYINHLLQNTGITPACSEEERLAAEDIAQIFRNHGFDPEVQEFNAPAPSRLAFAVTGILAFAGALLMGIGGGIGFRSPVSTRPRSASSICSLFSTALPSH